MQNGCSWKIGWSGLWGEGVGRGCAVQSGNLNDQWNVGKETSSLQMVTSSHVGNESGPNRCSGESSWDSRSGCAGLAEALGSASGRQEPVELAVRLGRKVILSCFPANMAWFQGSHRERIHCVCGWRQGSGQVGDREG